MRCPSGLNHTPHGVLPVIQPCFPNPSLSYFFNCPSKKVLRAFEFLGIWIQGEKLEDTPAFT